jgi:hypothetical protein
VPDRFGGYGFAQNDTDDGGGITVVVASDQGIWSYSGAVPSVESEVTRDVFASNAKRFVHATRDGLRLGNSTGNSTQPLPVLALPPLWEVVWAPDSKKVAVNFSDGGAVGMGR